MADLHNWDNVKSEWRKDREYCKEYNEMFPYGDVAKAIVALRVKHHLTQERLAKLLGKSQPFVARLESGRVNVSIRALQDIAKAVGEKVVLRFDAQAAAMTGEDRAGMPAEASPSWKT